MAAAPCRSPSPESAALARATLASPVAAARVLARGITFLAWLSMARTVSPEALTGGYLGADPEVT